MDRSFLNALERWLESPDEDFDEEGDECDLADIERQKRIDKEDWQARCAEGEQDGN